MDKASGHLRQNTDSPRDPKEHGVEALLLDVVVLQQDSAVGIDVGPGVLDLDARKGAELSTGQLAAEGAGEEQVSQGRFGSDPLDEYYQALAS